MPDSKKAAILAPGASIGILGGGQLGRMLAVAAAQLGFKTHIYCPNEKAPAFAVASARTVAAFDDEAALAEFAQKCDVITFEFENIPLAAAARVAQITPLYPSQKALEISQDRGAEKKFLQELHIPIADWWPVNKADDLHEAFKTCAAPLIVKTRRLGYDGKGQAVVKSANDIAPALSNLDGAPAIAERMISFDFEISIVLVRSPDGSMASYDPARNIHEGGILKSSHVPCGLSDKRLARAHETAATIAAALDYCGVLAVEFFVEDDHLLVNEIAPRVHNSGHWTQDACLCDQFENHIRAIAGWPCGSTARHSNAKMTNLLGEMVLDWQELAASPDTALHLYGKDEIKQGRKLGHMTQIFARS